MFTVRCSERVMQLKNDYNKEVFNGDLGMVRAIAPPNPTGSVDLKDLLTDWHCKDPVDSDEQDRNDLIASLQGTRNKFIDDPSLVSCSNIATFPDD